MSRYKSDSIVEGGKIKGTAQAVARIRKAMRAGSIKCKIVMLQENSRLDKLAGMYYGDGRLWWVIAAASNIGWGLQVPAGTNIRIPMDLSEVMRFV